MRRSYLEVFYKKGVSRKRKTIWQNTCGQLLLKFGVNKRFYKIRRKAPVMESPFMNCCKLETWSLSKKSLSKGASLWILHWRIPILKNTCSSRNLNWTWNFVKLMGKHLWWSCVSFYMKLLARCLWLC